MNASRLLVASIAFLLSACSLIVGLKDRELYDGGAVDGGSEAQGVDGGSEAQGVDGRSEAQGVDGGDSSAESGCNTQSDPNNCGTCGHVCNANAGGCFAGVCGNEPLQMVSAPVAWHTCVLVANGHVYCWGANDHGQLGNNDPSKMNQNHAVLVTAADGGTFDNVVEIAVGGSYDPNGLTPAAPHLGHTCARKNDGSIWCWGNGRDGQLADQVALDWTGGSPDDVIAPQQVPGLSGYRIIGAGGRHTCAVDSSQNLWCWGSNDYASLGHGLNTDKDVNCISTASCAAAQAGNNGGYYCCNSNAIQDPSVSGVRALSVGENDVCVVDSIGTQCWGRHDVYNQLAEGWDSGVTLTATPVTIGVTADHVVAGWDFECAYQTGSPAMCWGKNDEGTLGTGDYNSPANIVTWGSAVDGGVVPVSVALGAYHACVADKTGRVLCSGSNTWGTLGAGTAPGPCIGPAPPCVNTPVTVISGGSPLTGAVEVAVGMQHSCARTSGGSVYCWGDNSTGQLGDSTTSANSTSAVAVKGLP